MVRSMIAGVAGLKAHQSKMDVIGNNIANVNTWGFKGFSYNFMDAMYTNSITSTGGNVEAGAAGGRNASQVGYGSQLSSISNVFENGAPSPSANPMDCMIDGTGFFLVGNMVNGAITDIKTSGLYLSRVGIFRVDDNRYLVDDQRSYVYGYAVKEGTGIPEIPATAAKAEIEGVDFTFVDPTGTDPKIKIAGIEISIPKEYVNEKNPKKAVEEWVDQALKNPQFDDVVVQYGGMGPVNDNNHPNRPKFTITYKKTGTTVPDPADNTKTLNTSTEVKNLANIFFNNDSNKTTDPPVPAADLVKFVPTDGVDYKAGVEAEYEDDLSTIRIPRDSNGQFYKLDNYSIREDGTVVGVDEQNRVIIMGKLALVQVQNPNGLEKTTGYYYQIGDNAGDVSDVEAGTGPAGIIKPGYLEMANVDLANEFSNIITTQRGFQANSKIITVTDEMLQELVNMKR